MGECLSQLIAIVTITYHSCLDSLSHAAIVLPVNFCHGNAGKADAPNASNKKAVKMASLPTKCKAPAKKPRGGGGGGGGSLLNASQVKILETVGKLYAIHIRRPTKDQVQTLSGNAKTEAGFVKNIGILKKRGYLSKTLELTETGHEYLGGDLGGSLDVEEYHGHVKDILGSHQARQIYDLLVDGKTHGKDEIVDVLGLDRNKLSGFEKNLSKMKSLGFVEKTKTTVWLTDRCFLLGRPN